jgi:hypothetical protein
MERVSEVVYAQGSDGGGRWVYRGPRICVDPAAGQAAWERRLRTGLQSLMGTVKAEARAAYADVPAVRDGFAYETQTSPYARGRLVQRSDRAHIIEYPTRAHIIVATNAPYLWFPWGPSKSAWARVKRVHHPGTKGRHAIDPIFAKHAQEFAALLDQAAEEMVNV